MTGSTGIMGHRISAGQRWWITMTACTIRSNYLDQTRMVWQDRRMRRLPTGVMTGLTVAAGSKGLAYR